MNFIPFVWVTALILVTSYGSNTSANGVTQYQYRVIESYPHGTDVFTQGLEFHQGILYESAGQRGQSRLFTRRLNNINPDQQQRLTDQYFAEGITLLNNKVYQLTWQSRQGFIYQAENLKPLGNFSIAGEGWGLTNNGKHLIVSNGSNQLSFVNPNDFTLSHTINVTIDNKALANINELEWVDGLIYANIWQSNWIVMIDPDSGHVVGKVYLKDLLAQSLRNAKTDVLNGIAYDSDQQRLFVTGKYWPRLFHIELLPPNQTTLP